MNIKVSIMLCLLPFLRPLQAEDTKQPDRVDYEKSYKVYMNKKIITYLSFRGFNG